MNTSSFISGLECLGISVEFMSHFQSPTVSFLNNREDIWHSEWLSISYDQNKLVYANAFNTRCSDSGDLKIRTLVMGHSLIRSLVRPRRSLVRLLRTARFARTLRCAHSLAPELVGQCSLICTAPSFARSASMNVES